MSHEAQADRLTDDQIHGRACRKCRTKEAPLHPDETLTTHPYPDVVRETVSVLCTGCLVAGRSGDRGRYEILAPGAEGNSTRLFVIRDTRTGKLVEDDEGTLIRFTIRSSAEGWVRGQIYLSEAGHGRR